MTERMPEEGDELKGRYRLMKRIHVKSMNAVFKAWDIRARANVIVKVARIGTDGENAERLRREGVVLATLRHPRIVRALDAWDGGENGYALVTEFLEGESLETRLDRDGTVLPREAVAIACEALEALEAVHAAGLVHRDVKPGNLMVRPRGAVLIDFGTVACRAARRAKRLTQPNITIGSVGYMAPEQLQSSDVDARADLYALGRVLYGMLTGRCPVNGDEPMGLRDFMRRVTAHDPMPFSETAPDLRLPKALEQAVLKSLARNPAERFASAAAMRAELLAAAP